MKTNQPTDLIARVKKLVATKKLSEARRLLKSLHTSSIVDLFDKSGHAEKRALLKLLPKKHAAQVFRRLDIEHKKSLLKELSPDETRSLLEPLKPDERVSLIQEMPEHLSRTLLRALEPEDLAETEKLLSYPKQSVGRLMTPEFVAVKKSWDVTTVLAHIRNRAKNSETINTVYVVDENFSLLGQVDLSKIVLADSRTKVTSILDTQIATLSAHDDQEEAVQLMNTHRLSVIPVTNDNNGLIGIVTFDDIVEIAQKETSEDIYKSSAIIPIESSYQRSSVRALFQKRIGWLMGLVLVSLASSSVIAAFEETLSAAIALAFFIPLLIASGGNAGAQSATLIIRAISLGEINARDWFRTSGKEMVIGASLALSLGVFSAVMGLFRGGMEIGIIVGLSMAAIIVVTNLLGTLLPFVLSKFKVDPAVASGPLVTSVADVIGLLIYFSIASAILGQIA